VLQPSARDWEARAAVAYVPAVLRTTHTSSVTEEQIDHLGHMNVRWYAVNALAGTRAVLAELPGWDDRPYELHDVYTRHHREQLLGTPLVVRSAPLAAAEHELRIHHELAAEDTGILAATFVHGLRALDGAGRPAALPPEVVEAARARAVGVPPYAAARTISLDSDLLATAPALDVAVGRGLAMRKPRVITAEECEADGRYRVENAPLLTWGGEPLDGDLDDVLHETSDGRRMGWAMMETRLQTATGPTIGTRIQSFGACVGLHEKVMHRVNWAYDLEAGALLTAFESVSLAFDIDARRPMPIPRDHRVRELARVQADLAPQPVG
jgi:acyl-CoA thioester hydrolase